MIHSLGLMRLIPLHHFFFLTIITYIPFFRGGEEVVGFNLIVSTLTRFQMVSLIYNFKEKNSITRRGTSLHSVLAREFNWLHLLLFSHFFF